MGTTPDAPSPIGSSQITWHAFLKAQQPMDLLDQGCGGFDESLPDAMEGLEALLVTRLIGTKRIVGRVTASQMA